MKKLSRRDRMWLAHPGTSAAMDAAMEATRRLYGPKIEVAKQEMLAIIAGRNSGELKGDDAVRFMAAKARFDQVAIAQKHFAEADLTARLDPGRDGSETVDA